jgi:hypothetical protein
LRDTKAFGRFDRVRGGSAVSAHALSRDRCFDSTAGCYHASAWLGNRKKQGSIAVLERLATTIQAD